MFPGGDPFAQMFGMMNQMDRMMNQMFQDPFYGMPHQPVRSTREGFLVADWKAVPAVGLCADTTARMCVLQQQPPPGFQQYPQTVPRVEEVPHEAVGHRSSRTAGNGPIVEEPGMCPG
jgi:hypothetical protein